MAAYPIVGMHFGMERGSPAKALVEYLPVGAALILRAEPDNAHDPNAIRVLVPGTSFPESSHEELASALQGFGFTIGEIVDADEPWHLGYIPRDFAAEVKARGFPEGIDVAATFSVNIQGKPRVRYEEDWQNDRV